MRLCHIELHEGPNWGAIDKKQDVPSLGSGEVTPTFPSTKDVPTLEPKVKPTQPKVKPTQPKAKPKKPKAKPETKSSGGRLLLKNKSVAREFSRVNKEFQNKLVEAAQLYGNITVTSGRRTRKEQERLVRELPPGRAASPDKSPHVISDVAVDIRRPQNLVDLCVLVAALSIAGIKRIGVYDTSLHLDDRGSANELFASTGGRPAYNFLRKQGLVTKHYRNAVNNADLRKDNYVVD